MTLGEQIYFGGILVAYAVLAGALACLGHGLAAGSPAKSLSTALQLTRAD